MKKEKLITFGVIVVVLLIVGTIIYFKTGLNVKDIPSEEVAKWIGNRSAVYVQAGCSHCVDQENLFGENWKYINSIDYQENPRAFLDANITATPTWVINGNQYVGFQTIDKLKELTGYPE